MRAIRVTEFGGLDTLKYATDAPVPTPKPNEVYHAHTHTHERNNFSSRHFMYPFRNPQIL